jgi:hypothetical protein
MVPDDRNPKTEYPFSSSVRFVVFAPLSSGALLATNHVSNGDFKGALYVALACAGVALVLAGAYAVIYLILNHPRFK